MGEDDPHIHVEAGLNGGAATRDMLARTFGLVADLPSEVTTGCGQRVPRAMTSGRPESVTCLACREHAHRQHLQFAEQAEKLCGLPGVNIAAVQAKRAAERHRDLARRYTTPDS